MTRHTPILLAGNMCDGRLWPAQVRAALPGAMDADLTRDDTVVGMAHRTLASVEGMLLPVGFSMGGIVALAMARLAPERIAGMVLLDTNAGADLPERAALRPRQQADVRAGGLERIIIDELKPNYLAASRRSDGDLLEELRAMALALGPEVFVRQSEALRTRADQRDVLPTLSVPIFVGCGDEDRLCPPEWHAELAATARDAVLHVVPDAGHTMPLERPEALAPLLATWTADRLDRRQ